MSTKIVILDRDGVINEDLLGYVTKPKDFKPIQGSIESISRLSQNGIKVAIATNQACINKKIITKEDLEIVHKYMMGLVLEANGIIDYIAYCPHAPEEKCPCRKPEIGLLKKIEKKLNLPIKNSFFVGDKESDILAAKKYGCIPLLVKTGYGNKTLKTKSCPPAEHCFKNLKEAVSYILKK